MKVSRITTRYLTLVISLLILFTTLAGCGSQSQDTQSATSAASEATTQATTTTAAADPNKNDWELDLSPVTLDVFEDWPAQRDTLYETPVYKRVVKETGVGLKITTPVTADGQKLALMLASDSLPDLVQLESNSAWCDSFINQAIEAGKLWSFDELIDKYAPKFKSIVQPEYFNDFKAADGKTYKYATAINTQQSMDMKKKYGAIGGQNAVLIRKDLYEGVGSPDVTTPDGFMNCLKAIKAKYNLIPYTGPSDGWQDPTGQWGPQFGLAPYYVKDGKVFNEMRSPEARQAVSFANKMATFGLMPKEAMTDQPDICQKRVLNGEVITYHWNTFEEGKTVTNKPDQVYVSLAPFSTYKVYNTAGLGLGWKIMIIPKTSKAPDRVIRYMEYLASPTGQEAVYWGLKGESPANGGKFSGDVVNGPQFYMDGDKPTYYPEWWAAKLADWGGVGIRSGIGEIPYGTDAYLSYVPQWNPNEPITKKSNELYGDKIVYARELSIQIASDSPEGIINTKVGEIFKQYLAKVVFAPNEQEALKQFDAMLAECDSAGLPKLEEYYNKVYQENLSKQK